MSITGRSGWSCRITGLRETWTQIHMHVRVNYVCTTSMKGVELLSTHPVWHSVRMLVFSLHVHHQFNKAPRMSHMYEKQHLLTIFNELLVAKMSKSMQSCLGLPRPKRNSFRWKEFLHSEPKKLKQQHNTKDTENTCICSFNDNLIKQSSNLHLYMYPVGDGLVNSLFVLNNS